MCLEDWQVWCDGTGVSEKYMEGKGWEMKSRKSERALNDKGLAKALGRDSRYGWILLHVAINNAGWLGRGWLLIEAEEKAEQLDSRSLGIRYGLGSVRSSDLFEAAVILSQAYHLLRVLCGLGRRLTSQVSMSN